MATKDQNQAGKKPARKTKKEKREDIVLTKDNLLYQPLALAVNGYEATAFQQNVVIADLRLFQQTKDRLSADLRTGAHDEPSENIDNWLPEIIDKLRTRCNEIKDELSFHIRGIYELLQQGDTDNMAVTYVYLNILQESQEFVTSLRKMLRASGKLNLAPSTYRSFSRSDSLQN